MRRPAGPPAGFSGFLAAMTAALTRHPALDALTTRRTDDPAVALLDAWSAVLEVLTFYGDRIADEGYLGTATEPRSLTELARTVGHRPGRGRASAVALAFTLEDAAGAPPLVPLAAGTRVASLPGPGELPRTYETTHDLLARPGWNAMRARTRAPRPPVAGDTSAYVEGVRTDLAVGDGVLLVGSEREAAGASQQWAFRRLSRVRPLAAAAVTRIEWVDPLGSPSPQSGREGDERVPGPRDLRVVVLRHQAAVFGAAAPDFRLVNESAGGGRPDPEPVRRSRAAALAIPDSAKEPGRYAETEIRVTGPDWPGFAVRVPGQPENTVDLDTTYPLAIPGSWAVLTRRGVTACYRVLDAVEESRTDFTLNARVTRLTMRGPTVSHLFSRYVRQTTAWVGSEPLSLAEPPLTLPVQGREIPLARAVPAPEAGRAVVVRGPRPTVRVGEGVRGLRVVPAAGPPVALHPGDLLEVRGPVTENSDGSVTWVTGSGTVTAPAPALQPVPAAEDAPLHSEAATIAGPTPDEEETAVLRLAAALTGCYDREAVRVLGNVAEATHGETRTEVLGGGDAGAAHQRFTLAHAPLTHVAVASDGEVASTLTVRVDGRQWREVPRFLGCGPDEEVFTTDVDDEGRVTLRFGDGRRGARLPTGDNNVTATYRVGTGVAGRVAADQLTLPMSRPLGLRAVTNPQPSGLAADAETPEEVRANTPRAALAMERVVSLRDVEDFARAVPGIGQALSTRLWDGRRHLVHLTVAGTGGQAVDAQARSALRSALLAAGDARLPLRVDTAEVVGVPVRVSVVVDPAHRTEAVLDAVAAALTGALAPTSRALGRPLTTGDVVLACHAVPGVVAVHVTLPRLDVPAARARFSGGGTHPAQLVVLAPGGLAVSEASS